jgi:hypothetical protein
MEALVAPPYWRFVLGDDRYYSGLTAAPPAMASDAIDAARAASRIIRETTSSYQPFTLLFGCMCPLLLLPPEAEAVPFGAG